MRITITEDTYNELQSVLKEKEYKELSDTLKEARELYLASLTDKKRSATNKAVETKKEVAKNKVINAVRLLKMQNDKVNANKVAKIANINYATAAKYLKEMKRESLLDL